MENQKRESYPLAISALHWTLAILILALIGLGWYMVDIPRNTPERGYFFNLHKSLGVVALLLAAIFVIWRLRNRPPALPDSIPAWEKRAADVGHWLLYIGLVVVPLSGYIESNFTKWGVDFFGYKLESWGWDQEPGNTIYTVFNILHVWGSWIFAAVIGLHVAAAIKHGFQRDGVLSRMLPFRNNGSDRGGSRRDEPLRREGC